VTADRVRWEALLATAVKHRFPDVEGSAEAQSRLPRL